MDQYQLRRLMADNPNATLRDLVRDLIYDDVIHLRIKPGTKLNVNQIASTLGISRTPVAEAITDLAGIGFVVSHDGQSGSYVLTLELSDMINLYRVRDCLESEAASLCAHAADEQTVQQLSKLADSFKDSVLRRDIRGMRDTDMPFHRLIIDSCGNEYLIKSYEMLLPKLTMYQSSMLEFIVKGGSEHNPWMPSVTYNHISIVSAIRMRMPDLARKAMSEHIDASLNFTSLVGNGMDPFAALK